MSGPTETFGVETPDRRRAVCSGSGCMMTGAVANAAATPALTSRAAGGTAGETACRADLIAVRGQSDLAADAEAQPWREYRAAITGDWNRLTKPPGNDPGEHIAEFRLEGVKVIRALPWRHAPAAWRLGDAAPIDGLRCWPNSGRG